MPFAPIWLRKTDSCDEQVKVRERNDLRGLEEEKRILIAEDSELNRAMLCEILSGEYQVIGAGKEQPFAIQ